MKYYSTSPEYVRIKVREEQIDSNERAGRLWVAIVLIGGMTLFALTAYQLSQSALIFDFFNKKCPVKMQEAQKSLFEPQRHDEGKLWFIIVHYIYNPLVEGESKEEYVEVK